MYARDAYALRVVVCVYVCVCAFTVYEWVYVRASVQTCVHTWEWNCVNVCTNYKQPIKLCLHCSNPTTTHLACQRCEVGVPLGLEDKGVIRKRAFFAGLFGGPPVPPPAVDQLPASPD